MYDLGAFSLDDMIHCGAALRGLGEGAAGMQDTADRVVRVLYESLVRPSTGERACALVRFFETRRFDELDAEGQRFALRMAGGAAISPKTTCLVLVATVGDEPSWSDPRRSSGHLAIPIPSEEALSRMPMVSKLCEQLGITKEFVVRPDTAQLEELAQRTYDVFFVERAAGCPWLPAQVGFVDAYGIASVLGLGGVLPSGRVFVVLMFSKVGVSEATATLFRPLALAVKLAVLPWSFGARVGAPESNYEEASPCTP